jgi:protein-L-isoaspartate(D-aspartate) O-methyltransferase
VILIEGAVQHVPPAIVDQLAEGGRLGTVIAAHRRRARRGHLMVKEGGVASGRPIFDAGTPALPGSARRRASLFERAGQLWGYP